ncbi:MAG TPA: carboxylesterase family protein [Steroidobacteraceae bacterium]
MSKTDRARIAGTTCIVLLALAACTAQAAHVPLDVKTQYGWVGGALERGVVAFKGIPYAAPPRGVLRWAAPQAAEAWKGIRPAVEYGPDCMQRPTPGDAAPLRTETSEDCLYVNIWRPAQKSTKPLPVMVWIYGGWYVDGGTSPAVYDGSAFARRGVVLVSFNYRLGNFGFFAFPALARAGVPEGDFAFMDQMAALKWVQRNIAAFGGDPQNVTVFGESCGGASVNALLINPQANGLFQKAIIESGGGAGWLTPERPLEGGADSGEAIDVRLARHLGVDGRGPQALEALRALPAKKVVDGLNMATLFSDPNYVGGPMVDGHFYFGAPVREYARGMGARVPVMIGANTADLGWMDAKSLPALFASLGPAAAEARAAFDPTGKLTLQQVSDEIGGAAWMIEPARAIARTLSARGQPVYEYRFSYIPTSMRGKWPGVWHAAEIPFVFDTVRAHYGAQTSAADEAMAREVQSYWVAFARTGRPVPAGEPAWPRYERSTDRLMNFTDRGPRVERDPWRKRLDLTERVWPLKPGIFHPSAVASSSFGSR